MNTANNFKFTTQNPKAQRYFWFILAGIVLGVLWMILTEIIFVGFALFIVSMVISFTLFTKNRDLPEKITFYDTYFQSRIFGKIHYEEIRSARPAALDSGQGLKLKLKDKKKMWWTPLGNREEYENFVKALSEALEHLDMADVRVSESIRSAEGSRPIHKQESQAKGEDVHSVDMGRRADLTNDLKKVRKKNKKSGSVATVLSGLVLLLLALYGYLKTSVFPEMIQERNERIMGPIRQGVQDKLEKSATLKDSGLAVVRQYATEHGPYFLYSNDTTATINYIPSLKFPRAMGSGSGVTSLVLDNPDDEVWKKFLTNPDSVEWNMVIFSEYQNFQLQDIFLPRLQKDSIYVHLGVVNNTVLVPNISKKWAVNKENLPDSIPFQASITIPIDLNNRLELQKGKDWKAVFEFLQKHPETTKIYLAARKGQGKMNKELFTKIVAIFKESLVSVAADTTAFTRKEFYK